MVSYGEKLRSTREELGLDLERICLDMAVEKRYLEGLENEDSSVFAGEAYFVGFLKNYASYLGIEPEYILDLYHKKEIQESPIPKELYTKKHSKTFVIAISSIIAVTVALIVAFIIIFVKVNKKEKANNVVVVNNNTNHQYELSERKFQKRVYKGDQLIVPTEDDEKVILTVRDTLSSFGLDVPSGSYYIELADEKEIDINGDDITDMIIYVSDISSTDESCGAEISILLHQGISNQETVVVDDDIPLSTEIKNKHPYKVILEDNRAYPFTINASFRGPCLFRDKVDFNESVETYFSRGEAFTATPKNGIRLWISNNNTVKFTIIADSKTFDLDIGAQGQVMVEDIKWIKDTDGKYKLVIIELD